MTKEYYNCLKDMRILLVENDAEYTVFLLGSLRGQTGPNVDVIAACSLAEAFSMNDARPFDVCVLDLELPDSSGMKTLSDFHSRYPDMPVIVLTGPAAHCFPIEAVKGGAQDYLVKGEALSGLIVRSICYSIERQKAMLALKESNLKLKSISNGMIQTIEKIVESRDPYTAGHQRRVAELAGAIAMKLMLPAEAVSAVTMGAMIHDIGKLYVPGQILVKPGRLSDMEYEIIKQHPGAGRELVHAIKFPWPVGNMIHQHHEREDGSGYPQGLKSPDILMESAIISVADVTEAMGFDRPYRKAPGIGDAFLEINKYKGIRYRLSVVEACEALFMEDDFKFISPEE